MKKKNKNFLGFTLVELLVVISIIGVLTIITASSFVESQKKSRDAARKANLKSLADAVSLYYTDQGRFPDESTINELIGAEGELSVVDTIYMKKVPKDTRGGKGDHLQIKYVTGPNKMSFRLYTNLENNGDIDCSPSCLATEYPVTAGCCYVVTSPNINSTDALR